MVAPLVRLRDIADEIRSLSDMSGGSGIVDVMGTCGDLFTEAIELGAFSGVNHADLRNKVTEALIEAEHISPKFWRNRVFNALANHYAPVLFAQEYGHRLACGPIADAIEAEVRRIETSPAASPPPTNRHRSDGDDILIDVMPSNEMQIAAKISHSERVPIAVAKCLELIGELRESSKPLPWCPTDRNLQKVAQVSNSVALPLSEAFQELKDCGEKARSELLEACRRRVAKGLPTTPVVNAFGKTREFALDIAVERINEDVDRVNLFVEHVRATQHDDALLPIIDGLSNPNSEEWKAFLAVLQAEARDATNELRGNGEAHDGSTAPPAAETKNGEGRDGTNLPPRQPISDPNAKRREVLEGLQPADRKAYLSFEYAESKAGKRLEDRGAHDWLEENGIDTDKGDAGELTDYKLPVFDTWSRQLRNARRPLGEQKYNQRAGRATGRSIVWVRNIERQQRRDV